MSSLLISNKKVLSCNWLAANNNFWSHLELKMWISGALVEQKIFFWQSDTCFWTKGELFYPQIRISESTQSGRKNPDFFTIHVKQIQIHVATKNRLNSLSL